jgi:hypothetical protein
MENVQELDLRQELENLTRKLGATITPEALHVLQQAKQELLESGIIDRVVKVGGQAPLFTLPNSIGVPYRLSDGISLGPVVLTFYRGGW